MWPFSPEPGASRGRTTDITDLFRACLVALRVPEQVDAYQLRFIALWRVPDAIARITRMLAAKPAGGALATFLPGVDGRGADKELRCRARFKPAEMTAWYSKPSIYCI